MPPLVTGGGAFYLLRAITAFENAITKIRHPSGINVIRLGRDYCLIVNRIEKNHREQKDLIGRQLTGDRAVPDVPQLCSHKTEAGSKRSSRCRQLQLAG